MKDINKLKRVDFYWSDRWQRVISIFRCKCCKKEATNLCKSKPELEKEHVCL